MELGKAYLEIAPSTRGLAPAIRSALGEVERGMGRWGEASGRSYSEGFGRRSTLGRIVDGALMGVGMGAVRKFGEAASGVFSTVVGGGFSRALNIEQAQAKLAGLGHSAESVEDIMENALTSVKGTAFGLGEAAAVAASTVAAGVKPGGDLERTLKLVGDAATIAGTDMGTMGSIINKVATSDMMQMDVANQLMDAGIPIMQMVADQMGVTATEARELASEGKVSFETFQAAMEAGLGGAAQESGETFQGAIANTKAALGRIGESFLTPILGSVTSLAQAAIPMIDTLAASLTPVAEAMGSWLEKQIPKLVGFLERVPGLFSGAADRAKSLWQAFTDSPIGAFISGVWDQFKSLAGTLRSEFAPILERAADLIVGRVIPYFRDFAGIVGSVLTPVMTTIVSIWRDNVLPVLSTVVGFIVDRVIPAVLDVGNRVILPILRDVAEMVTTKVLPVIRTFADYITTNVVPVVKDFADRVLIPAFEGIASIVSWAWDTVIKPALEGLHFFIEERLGPVLKWLWEKVVAPTFRNIGDAVSNFGSHWETIWNGIQSAAAKPVNFVIETVWNNGLRKALNLIPGVELARANPISLGSSGGRSRSGAARPLAAFQSGGYVDMPWSAANRDPYVGLVGGVPALRFEGTEFIVNRDSTRKHRRLLEDINADRLPAYANGGPVRPVPGGHSGWNGGRYRSGKYHGGLDFPAATGTPISAMWAGSVVRALRLNRSYGHHAILSHANGLQTLYAHMSRLLVSQGQSVARGQRIGLVGSTGNSTGPHLHLEVRRGGARLNPVPFLSGAGAASAFAGASVSGQASGDPALLTALSEIPKKMREVHASLSDLGGPWGSLIKTGVADGVQKAAAWAIDKIPGLGPLLDFILPSKSVRNFSSAGGLRGYATGTDSAAAGWATVGENGPELIRFRGGEKVLNADATKAAHAAQQTLVRVELVDERLRGLVRAEVRQMKREGVLVGA